ncbi:hypothetical protein GGX14DRAFT_658915 [Mycena pura]|uniref:Ubiquitin-like domain-containing protein n=1 Tax=Mycena pura TaxID=153505 RepID=A0AAD6Y5Y7_9AGAR|nr:hypothetical protein GGX14DRAFT_658915 [Mycena pura]
MPLVAAALTFGSFGDILEAAKIAKRIIDVLRKGGSSHERQKLISTLKHICDDLSRLTLLPENHFTARLWDEVVLCRSLLDQFHAKMSSYESFLGRIRMVALEEKELTCWRARISERRVYNCMTSDNTWDASDPRCNISGPGLTLLKHRSKRPMKLASSEIRQVGIDVQAVQQAIHKIPRDISDPVFRVMDPLGKPIIIQLSRCNSFNDLDRILKAYICNYPEAGSTYVERGDYSIVSSDGVIIPRLRLRGELRAGIEFDMSIIKRKRLRQVPQKCPHCSHTNQDAVEGSWVNCSNLTCRARYQVSAVIEEISSPQTSLNDSRQDLREPFWEEDRAESFRLVQILYVHRMGGLEDFDWFREQDIDFKRDFGQWFNNPDDVAQGGVAPPPGLMIFNPTSMNPAAMPLPLPPTPDNLFSSEFMQSMAGGLEDFDVGLFREQDINFERDFGQWFNNPDDVGSLDLGPVAYRVNESVTKAKDKIESIRDFLKPL